jgi:hypothetical protein
MAHLITPIMVEGNELCCDPVTLRTTEVLIESATEISPDQWEIFRATAYGDEMSNSDAKSTETVSGTVVFGICCASQVVLEVWGEIETLNDGYDWLEVRLNGVREFYHESIKTSEDPWDSVAVGPFTVTLNLDDRPCGHIIEIDGSTGDDIANDNIWWRARLVSIS